MPGSVMVGEFGQEVVDVAHPAGLEVLSAHLTGHDHVAVERVRPAARLKQAALTELVLGEGLEGDLDTRLLFELR